MGDMKILAVDDSPSLLNFLVSYLKESGHEVVEAPNGRVAADLLDNHVFDIIVSDLNMVILGGLELLTLVRKHHVHCSCPFILLTTELDAALKEEARNLGATGWMTKPFDPEKFDQLLSRFEPV
jgi:two-component system, chemotaxis family, chemotaxis protein CheY